MSIESDLNSLTHELRNIAQYYYIDDYLTNGQSEAIIFQKFEEINKITPTKTFFKTDKEFKIIYNINGERNSPIGLDLSNQPYVQEIKQTMKPSFSSDDVGLDGSFQITLAYPVVDKNNDLQGIIGIMFDPSQFFNKHGNIFDINSEYLVIIDNDAQFIVAPKNPMIDVVGKKFYDADVQQFLQNDPNTIKLFEDMINGNAAKYSITKTELGETLSTGIPIKIDEKTEYFALIVTHTESLYSDAESTLQTNRLVLISFAAALVVSIVLFAFSRDKLFKKEAEIIQIKKDLEIAEYKSKSDKLAAVGEAAARIAHDLRNPLSVIRATSEILQMQSKNLTEKEKETFEKQKSAIDRMSHQIAEVLDFVRSNPVTKQPIEFSKMINNVLNSILVPKRVKIIKPDKDFVLRCDPSQIEAVLVNLLRNAIDAVENDGIISIKLSEDQNFHIVSIEDTGHGIPEKNLQKIFEPLFTTKQKGTGLGLAARKNIIEQHGGTIIAENNPTTFTMKLPKNN
ncbi:ATP-binding protein [Candidatus Nitrosotenuis chungbukensis]|uniref:sensor histidine kinase n=1 Tax=Candidatus Nitrosotenuis chungbukensis TaxID=1353246 RepID=UPI00267113A5|nr:PAS domain-containing sensor histidine kinase [Candidatus Nitrosotenuis chungbukensis]WKT58639.1 ATP-binding protein [Candidatus Nitrosotenuis chungbukensis]